MADKSKPPMPVDRPLARAYLRKFTGWSTAYAPGLSDPTSLRIMRNCWITRENALEVRPGLRSVFAPNVWATTTLGSKGIVGSFETFFLADGTKALLFAYRRSDTLAINFRVAKYDSANARYELITLTQAGFDQTDGFLYFSSSCTYVRYLQIDNKIFILPTSTNADDRVLILYAGSEKHQVRPRAIPVPTWTQAESLNAVRHPDAAWINSATKTTFPAAETPTSGEAGAVSTGTLVDAESTDNTYSFGFFYTISNELGETAPSQMTVIKAKRGWSQWLFQAPDASGNPTTTAVSDPKMACDQLVVQLREAVWNAAVDAGATTWQLYMVTWSDQGAAPVEGLLVASTSMTNGATYVKDGWLQATAIAESYDTTLPIPSADERTNYTEPARASQGLTAGDRIILVNDRSDAAKIRWSSNHVGEYTNFSASKGGGYKTLTSGNLLIPVCVKLWQNPQSVDTLVVLCTGVDGYSSAYYMAPATVTGQSGSTAIMGFEETTATPGTVSPWGCEVINQGLYHPLDEQLMKSTASNYNISHKSLTDDISNKWVELLHKDNIVSATLDSRLYLIVHNPDGEELEDGCMGNEIWVLDVGMDSPTWSRWTIQANSLHKLEVGGKIYMAVVRPDAIFILDSAKWVDQYSQMGTTAERAIPWQAVTNTQGANRAHDAWSFLHQVNITFGNIYGRVAYGIRVLDNQGIYQEFRKEFRDDRPLDLSQRPLPWDIDDMLEIRRTAKEWELFVESVPHVSGADYDDDPYVSTGRVNLVQYRYTPASVNIGYEMGSVETFEYGYARNNDSLYPNGIPEPYLNLSRS